MAFLMLLSSTGFSIDLHYCQGNVKSFSFFGKAKSCHVEVNESHCSKKKKACHMTAPSMEQEQSGDCKKDCCSNKSFEISPDIDAEKIQIERLTIPQLQFVSVFVEVFILGHADLSKLHIPHLNYIPPILNRDIPIFIQSFLL